MINSNLKLRLKTAWGKALWFWLVNGLALCLVYLIYILSTPNHNHTWDLIGFAGFTCFFAPQAAFTAFLFYVFRIEKFALGSKTEAFILGIVEGCLLNYVPGFYNIIPGEISILSPAWLTAVILLLQGIVVRIYKLCNRHALKTHNEILKFNDIENLPEREEYDNKYLAKLKPYIKDTWKKAVRFYWFYSLSMCLVIVIYSFYDLADAIAGCIFFMFLFAPQATFTCLCFYVLRIERFALGNKIEALIIGLIEMYLMLNSNLWFINDLLISIAGDLSFILSPTLLTAMILLIQGIVIRIYKMFCPQPSAVDEIADDLNDSHNRQE